MEVTPDEYARLKERIVERHKERIAIGLTEWLEGLEKDLNEETIRVMREFWIEKKDGKKIE